jgi:hypothetical protein
LLQWASTIRIQLSVLSSTKRLSSYLPVRQHAELDSYSDGSLKQQSTGRYDDGRFVLDKYAELDSYSASSLKQQSTGHYKNPTQRVV